MRAAKLKPAFLRNVIFGNGGKQGDSRFARQQVITRGMQFLLFHVEANGEQSPARTQEKLKTHFLRERASLVNDVLKVSYELDGLRTRVRQQRHHLQIECASFSGLGGIRSSLQSNEKRVDVFHHPIEGRNVPGLAIRINCTIISQRRELGQQPGQIELNQATDLPDPFFGLPFKPQRIRVLRV